MLDAWAAGDGSAGIMARFLTRPTVGSIVVSARRKGDPRAVLYGLAGWAGAKPKHRESVLDAWASDPTILAGDLGARFGVSAGSVHSILRRAGEAGDPRAVEGKRGRRVGDGGCHRGGRPYGPNREAVVAAWSNHPERPASALAAALGISTRAFHCTIGRARRDGDDRAAPRGRGFLGGRPTKAKSVASDAFSGLHLAAGCHERPHTASRGNA